MRIEAQREARESGSDAQRICRKENALRTKVMTLVEHAVCSSEPFGVHAGPLTRLARGAAYEALNARAALAS